MNFSLTLTAIFGTPLMDSQWDYKTEISTIWLMEEALEKELTEVSITTRDLKPSPPVPKELDISFLEMQSMFPGLY